MKSSPSIAGSRRSAWKLTGRVLFLCEDRELLRRQLAGCRAEPESPLQLLDNLSTDEIIPAWACYHYDDTLGRYALAGLRRGGLAIGELLASGVKAIACGHAAGCGSSRETAPLAQIAAGIEIVFARSFAKIYRQNCTNLGLLTCTNFDVLARLAAGQSVALDEILSDLGPLEREVVSAGGLLAWHQKYGADTLKVPCASACERSPENASSGLTFAEKVVLAHGRDTDGQVLDAVQCGASVWLEAHWRFSHDYTTAMAASQFRGGYGMDAKVHRPTGVVAFRDHLADVGEVMTQQRRRLGLLDRAELLALEQEQFCAQHSIDLIDASASDARGGICHNVMVEALVEPGQVVVGTDSHTCTAGALGALAFGVGSTDIAFAWASGFVRTTVPESVSVELVGLPPRHVCAKDIMLALLAEPAVRKGELGGAVIEFSGSALACLSQDEHATLTNMAVEAGALTGVIFPRASDLQELAAARRCDARALIRSVVRPDPDARYRARVVLDTSTVAPMVATPGDPQNGVALERLLEREALRVDIAYAGSCTGGKTSDIEMYAAVFACAERHGMRIAEHVSCYIQFGSSRVRAYAAERGYIALFERLGATVLGPGCGACIGAGPGTSSSPEQVTISAANRNYPGRSGPGRVYLGSPYVVAASAVAGYLAHPAAYLGLDD